MDKPVTENMPSFVQDAVAGLISVIDAGVMQAQGKQMLAGLDLSSLKGVAYNGDNQQVAALNNDDMARGTPGPGVSV